jgi:valyl-tRNA synthetase
MSKGRLRDEKARPTAQRVLAGVLDAILRLVHPVMPFVAESLWQALNESAFERGLPPPDPSAESVAIAAWPEFPASWQDPAMEARMRRMQDLVRGVREVRNRYNVDGKTPLALHVRCAGPAAEDFRTLEPLIKQLAGVGALACGPDVVRPGQSAAQVHPEFEAFVPLAGLIDVEAEAQRQEKQRAELEARLRAACAKLGNRNFVERAPAEVVQQQRDLVEELEAQLRAIEESLRALRGG